MNLHFIFNKITNIFFSLLANIEQWFVAPPWVINKRYHSIVVPLFGGDHTNHYCPAAATPDNIVEMGFMIKTKSRVSTIVLFFNYNGQQQQQQNVKR